MSVRVTGAYCSECLTRPASSTGLCGFCESKLSVAGAYLCKPSHDVLWLDDEILEGGDLFVPGEWISDA